MGESSWQFDPVEVAATLTGTAAAAQGLQTALSGQTDPGPVVSVRQAQEFRATKGIPDSMVDAATYSQSPIIAQAVAGFWENRGPTLEAMLSRVVATINATGLAAQALVDGDADMAADIGAQMTQAVESGDFTALAPQPAKAVGGPGGESGGTGSDGTGPPGTLWRGSRQAEAPAVAQDSPAFPWFGSRQAGPPDLAQASPAFPWFGSRQAGPPDLARIGTDPEAGPA